MHAARRAARGGPAGLRAPTSSRRSGWPRRWRRCAAGRWPGWPRSPRRPGRCCATATSCGCALINRRLVVGERLGRGARRRRRAVPLARDVAASQRRLRLRPEALEPELDLDLRREIDLGRSRLLHRLRLLGVDWGEPAGRPRAGPGHLLGVVASCAGSRSSRSTWSRPAATAPRCARRRPPASVETGRGGRGARRRHRAGRAVPAGRPARRAAGGARRARRPGGPRRRRRPPDGRAAGAGPHAALRRRPRHRRQRAARGDARAGRRGSASGCPAAVGALDDERRGRDARPDRRGARRARAARRRRGSPTGG